MSLNKTYIINLLSLNIFFFSSNYLFFNIFFSYYFHVAYLFATFLTKKKKKCYPNDENRTGPRISFLFYKHHEIVFNKCFNRLLQK